MAFWDRITGKKEAQDEAIRQSQRAEMEKEEKKKAEAEVEKLTERTKKLFADNYKLQKEKDDREKNEAKFKKIKWGPQRTPEWTDAEVERLRKSFLQKCNDSEGNPIGLKFLVMGPTGHGKSSFCNSCRSAILGKRIPATYHQVASISAAETSLTKKFDPVSYGDHWIIDMPGLYESKRIDSLNIAAIVSGKVPFYAELTTDLEVKNRCELPEASRNDVSCVVFVLKFDTKMTPELKRQLDLIVTLCGEGVIAIHLVLTCLDICDPMFSDTGAIPKMFTSVSVQEAVEKISKETGVPSSSISFVKNYTRETETDINTSLLHLRVLDSVLSAAEDQADKPVQKRKMKEQTRNKSDQVRVSTETVFDSSER